MKGSVRSAPKMGLAGAFVMLAVAAHLSAAQDFLFDGVPCQNCPKVTQQHYDAKACEAVFDPAISDCCPASFDCKSETDRGINPKECVYKNATYNPLDNVPIEDPCQANCYCSPATETRDANVVCANVECPSLFGILPEPGCRSLFNIDSCCSVDEECRNADLVEASERSSTCVAEGKEYKLGDEMYFDAEPCRKCVCTTNYTDSFGPNCTAIDCGMEHRDRGELSRGCIPLYYDGNCCNIEWICPGSDQVKGDAGQVADETDTPATHCSLGDIVAPRNSSLKTTNPDINCICATPPSFTCIQFANPEKAAQAKEAGKFEF